MCDWFGHFGSRFSNATLPDYHSFPVELIEEPNLTNEFLVEVIGELKRQLSYYNDAVDVRMRVSRETAETEFEKSIRFIWPWAFLSGDSATHVESDGARYFMNANNALHATAHSFRSFSACASVRRKRETSD